MTPLHFILELYIVIFYDIDKNAISTIKKCIERAKLTVLMLFRISGTNVSGKWQKIWILASHGDQDQSPIRHGGRYLQGKPARVAATLKTKHGSQILVS